MAADGLFAGKTKPSVGYTARFVPLEGDISQTVSIFVAERFFLKKTGDSVVAGELLFVVCSEERNRAPLKRRSGWDFSGGSVPRNA